MRRWVIVGIALMLGAFSLGAAGQAQDDDWGGGFRERHGPRMGTRLMTMLENERVKAALGLTDQQADRLRQIMVDAEKGTVKTRAEIAVRRIELRELMRTDKPDREAAMRKVQEISDLRGQMMKQHVESLLAAKVVLTPEQQKKLWALIETPGRTGFWRERFRAPGPVPQEEPGPPPALGPPPGEPPVQ